MALTDHDGLYGAVRFAEAARGTGVGTIFGAELGLAGVVPRTKAERATGARQAIPDPAAEHLLVLARGSSGYASLAAAISRAHLLGGTKGRPVYDVDELATSAGDWMILTGCRKGTVRAALEPRLGVIDLPAADRALGGLVDRFGAARVVVELTYAREPMADERFAALAELARRHRLRLVATTAAHYHSPARRRLATVAAAVRARTSLDDMDGWLPAWADAQLRSPGEMLDRFCHHPGAVAAAADLAQELAFDLALVAPQLPPFDVPDAFANEITFLRHLVAQGAATRYGPPAADSASAYAQAEHELTVIEQLGFAGYFLVVWDLSQFCGERGILAQGRGSAANSVVCYVLGVTAVDPIRYGLLFERFLSAERDGPPDIDIDIESGRREEVIQYVYAKHGREHAAQVANVITYRARSAVRDVAKALGYAQGQQDAWAKQVSQWSTTVAEDESAGMPAVVVELADELADAPRHLGIHSGGMVICNRPIIEVCPVEWGRMPGRSVLQWDKDDCAAIGLTKFDLLGLGMLSALRYTFEMVQAHHGVHLELHSIPADDPLVYDMLCEADTVGVFQIESRAQQATLPRLRPRTFHDLAIEIALIRPGPIQGQAVHPTCGAATAKRRSATRIRTSNRTWPKRSAFRCSRSSSCRSPSPPPDSRPGKRTSSGGPWAASGRRPRWRRCVSVSTPGWPRTASPARTRTTSGKGSRASPISDSPRATRSASPTWRWPRPG